MFFFFFNFFIIIIFILLGVAFFTLLERKGLAYSQNRLGPNKNSGSGILQPLLDALKLLSKESTSPHQNSKFFFFFIPIFFFFLMIFVWLSFPGCFSLMSSFWGFFFFLSISGLASIFIMMLGIMSYSKFGVMGGMRGVAQGISYEIIFSLLIFFFGMMSLSSGPSEGVLSPGSLIFFPWMICILAETNRAPFDFSEGESELISGFNVEYSGVSFVFIFLGEYGFLLSASFFTSKMFFVFPFFFSFFIFFFFIMIRGLLPRFRYDV